MNRLEKFNNLFNCPIRKKWLAKIKDKDIEFCKQFILDSLDLSKSDYEYKANRLFLDDVNKPKNHAYIWAVIIEVA